MIRVVSLFAGCGGFDMGLYRAAADLGIDVEVVAAYDHWEPAVKAYNANLPHPVAQVRDLKAMQRDELPPHDLVIGGPPCQPFSLAGKRKGHEDERNCLPDFLRLAGDSPYVMENVVSRLINAPWSEKLCAANFGDVTSRRRWFYSTHLLHVIPTPGPLRIRDIRDHAEDARILAKRYGWHGHDIRGNGKLVAIVTRSGDGNNARECSEAEMIPSLCGGSFNNTNMTAAKLRLGLRGNSASASAFEDDDVLGSIMANSFHANEASRIVACRNPSIVEMARAHSIPDTFDWAGATRTQKGQLVANSIPVCMATAVSKAILLLLAREKRLIA